jgi:hypothetical protein
MTNKTGEGLVGLGWAGLHDCCIITGCVGLQDTLISQAWFIHCAMLSCVNELS